MKEAIIAIKKIQHLFNFSDKEMATLFEISEKKYQNFHNRTSLLSLGSIKYFSHYLELDHNELLEGHIDYYQLANRWVKNNTTSIPKRYQVSPGSKIRTIQKILEPLAKDFGEHWRQKVLWHFQLHEDVLSNENQFINVLLVQDIFNYLKRELKLTEEHFRYFGMISHTVEKENSLTENVKNLKTSKQLYEKIFADLTPYYEKNFNYKIHKLTKDSMTLECSEKEEMKESLKVTSISHLDSNAYREGVIKSMPSLIGLPISKIVKTKCVHQGDTATLYQVHY